MNKVIYWTIFGIFLGVLTPLVTKYYFNGYFTIYEFSANFGIIGFMLGVSFSPFLKLYDNKYINFFIVVLTFTFSSIAYGCLLDLRFHSNQKISSLRFDYLLIPLAVSAFVYIFTASFLSLGKKINLAILISLLLAIPIFFVSLLKPYLYLYTFPSFLVFVSFVTLFINHLSKRRIANIIGHIVFFCLGYASFVILIALFAKSTIKYSENATAYGVAIGSCILPIFGIILYFLDYFNKGKSIDNNNKPLIDTRWFLSSAALIGNYSIIASPLSILNYERSIVFFEKTGILFKYQKRICFYYSIATFIIQGFFINFSAFPFTSLIVWPICIGIASFVLSYSFFVIDEKSNI